MATKPNNGWYSGDILSYQGYSHRYGAKMLKEAFINDLGGYRWIYQGGRISNNKFIPDSGDYFGIASDADLKATYTEVWTPDKDPSPVKGDLLSGKDRSGNLVILYYEGDQRVTRLTKCEWSDQPGSNASYSFYKGKLSELKILKSSYSDLPFSQV